MPEPIQACSNSALRKVSLGNSPMVTCSRLICRLLDRSRMQLSFTAADQQLDCLFVFDPAARIQTEGLRAAASILGIIELAALVGSLLLKYSSAVRSAWSHITRLRQHVDAGQAGGMKRCASKYNFKGDPTVMHCRTWCIGTWHATPRHDLRPKPCLCLIYEDDAFTPSIPMP